MTQQQQQEQPQETLAEYKQRLRGDVETGIQDMIDNGLTFSKDYNYKSALDTAFRIIDGQKTKVHDHGQLRDASIYEACTYNSVVNSLLDMVAQGLNVGKNQCYFIPRNGQLELQRSYFGSVTALKRLPEIKGIKANVVHEGDEFEIGSADNGSYTVEKFVPKFENLDKPIVGAFVQIQLVDGTIDCTVMTKKQIDTAWAQAKMSNNVRQKFAEEMAKRTVINRAAKMYINTYDGDDEYMSAYSRTTKADYEDKSEETPADNQANDLVADFKANKGKQKETPADVETETMYDEPEEVIE